MALARGILLWLPLARLQELYPEGLPLDLIQERRAAWNQVSEEEYQRYTALCRTKLDPSDNYVRLCSYQGEANIQASCYVNTELALHRALYVKDEKVAVDLLESSPAITWETLNMALRTGKVRIQAAALACRLSYGTPDLQISLMPWTEKLWRALRGLFRRTLEGKDEPKLAHTTGFLQLWPFAEWLADKPPVNQRQQEYIRGYVQAELSKAEPNLAEFEQGWQEHPRREMVVTGALQAGLLLDLRPEKLEENRRTALARILPQALLRLQGDFPLAEQKVDRSILTEESARQAKVLLDLLPQHPELAEKIGRDYCTQLEIVGGRPITGPLDPELRSLMYQVSHPELTLEDFQYFRDRGLHIYYHHSLQQHSQLASQNAENLDGPYLFPRGHFYRYFIKGQSQMPEPHSAHNWLGTFMDWSESELAFLQKYQRLKDLHPEIARRRLQELQKHREEHRARAAERLLELS